MLGALQRGTTQQQDVNGWRHQAVWIKLRNVLIAVYLVLFLHDMLVRILAYLVLPALTGIQLPPLPFYDLVFILILCLIAWRLWADPVWRKRLHEPEVAWMLAAVLIILAAGSLHVQALVHLVMLKGLLHPLLIFGVCYCLGWQTRLMMYLIITIAAINVVAMGAVFWFGIEGYQELILIAGELLPETRRSLNESVMRFAGTVVPYGLLVLRSSFTMFFIPTGALFWFSALQQGLATRLRIAAAVGAVIVAGLILFSFSRAAMATSAVIVLIMTVYWIIIYARSRDPRIRRNSFRLIIGVLALILVMSIAIVATDKLVEGEYLMTSSMFDPNEGRIAFWGRALHKLNSEGGWLLGVDSMYQKGETMVTGLVKERVWSEYSFRTVDNTYLLIALMTGLVGLTGYLVFVGAMVKMLWRLRLFRELSMLAGLLLVYQNFEASPNIAVVIFAIAGLMAGREISARNAQELSETAN